MRYLIMITMVFSLLEAEDIKILQYSGVTTTHADKEVYIHRAKHKKCYNVGVTPENIFGGDFSGAKVPQECKRAFTISLGVEQPMHLDPKIETLGELEVLHHIQAIDFESESYILIDTRRKEWYRQMTIPHAVNIPKEEIAFDPDFPEDFDKSLKQLRVSKDKNGTLDFSHAKVAVLFCNGAWCTQSAKAIKLLVKMGYPKEKLKWYRGGMQDWVNMGFSVVKQKR